jgi:hypothetical protein
MEPILEFLNSLPGAEVVCSGRSIFITPPDYSAFLAECKSILTISLVNSSKNIIPRDLMKIVVRMKGDRAISIDPITGKFTVKLLLDNKVGDPISVSSSRRKRTRDDHQFSIQMVFGGGKDFSLYD